MSEQDNRRLIEEQFAAMNAHDLDRCVKNYADSYIAETDVSPSPIRGAEGVKQFLSTYFKAFPDFHLDIEQIITSGDHVVVRWRTTGTHKGEFNGIAPTNRKINARGCTVGEIRNGRVLRSAIYSDQLAVLGQLGVFAAKGASAR
jgi:steroid delta-isomerase-like uncharacterized protein